MKNKIFAVAKTNCRNIKPSYIITAIIIGAVFAQDAVMFILAATGVYRMPAGNMTTSFGNYFFVLLIHSAVYIPLLNFRRMTNLGAKRSDFNKGCFLAYAVMAAAISLLSLILYHTYDRYAISVFLRSGTMDVIYWFRWIENGAAVAFFQLFAFLFLLAVFIHTLVSAQDKWYGWVADVIIVAIISVFTPIAPLRAALVWFFNLIIFNQYAFLQIAACLVLAAALFPLNKVILARKAI